jgi:hypothetical protein
MVRQFRIRSGRLARAFLTIACLASASAPAAYCPGLFASIDPSTLPKRYRIILENERIATRVQLYLEDPAYVQFFHDLKTAYTLRSEQTVVLRREKQLAISAKITPDGDQGARIAIESDRVPGESGSLDLQGLQLAVVRGLFESFSASDLSSIAVEWRFGWRVAREIKTSFENLGLERARHLIGCGGLKKFGAGFLGAGLGAGFGTIFSIWANDEIGDGTNEFAFAPLSIPAGGAGGAFALVSIACRKSSVVNGGYVVRFTRVAPPAVSK